MLLEDLYFLPHTNSYLPETSIPFPLFYLHGNVTSQQWDVLFYNFPPANSPFCSYLWKRGWSWPSFDTTLPALLCKSCPSFAYQYFSSIILITKGRFVSKQAPVSLACLEIRSRNEEAINSTRTRIYSLNVFLLPTLSTSRLFTCFWIDLVRALTTTGNTSAVASYTRVYIHEDSRASIAEKLNNCQRSKKWFTWHLISIIAENKLYSRHKMHLHTMKVYNTRSSQFC